jgi:hypothetical protein
MWPAAQSEPLAALLYQSGQSRADSLNKSTHIRLRLRIHANSFRIDHNHFKYRKEPVLKSIPSPILYP